MSDIASSNASGSSKPRLRHSVALLRKSTLQFLLCILAIAYLVSLNLHMTPFASATDASGYLNFAKQLAHGQVFLPARTLPGIPRPNSDAKLFEPMGWIVRSDTELMSPYYPPGAPLHFALGFWLAGEPAAVNFVNTLLTISTGLLLYLSCRYLNMEEIWSGTAVVSLYLCPLFIFGAIWPFSELAALTWALAALYAAMRVQDGWLWPLLCGGAYSIAVLVVPQTSF